MFNINKTLILSAVSALFLMGSCASNETTFSFAGSVGGVKDSTRVYIKSIERGTRDTLAQGYIVNNKFLLDGSVISPRMCELEIEKEINSSEGSYMSSVRKVFMLDNSKYNMSVAHIDSFPTMFNLDRKSVV